MGYIIAIAGKGGTGKTTIAALLVRILKEKNKGSILAVDADPNSNLAEALGIQVRDTIGKILDDVAVHPDKIPSGMSKDRFIEYEIHKAVEESEGFDVLTMGKPEGPGCYCYVNNVLRNVVTKLIRDYKYVVIDNEAGLEHLSRRTTRSADSLLVISDATPAGLRAAKRIGDLVRDLNIQAKKKFLIINRFDAEIAVEKIKDLDLRYLGNIPTDKQIDKISMNGGSLLALDSNAASVSVLRKLGEQIWN